MVLSVLLPHRCRCPSSNRRLTFHSNASVTPKYREACLSVCERVREGVSNTCRRAILTEILGLYDTYRRGNSRFDYSAKVCALCTLESTCTVARLWGELCDMLCPTFCFFVFVFFFFFFFFLLVLYLFTILFPLVSFLFSFFFCFFSSLKSPAVTR